MSDEGAVLNGSWCWAHAWRFAPIDRRQSAASRRGKASLEAENGVDIDDLRDRKKSVRELAEFFGGLDYVAIGPGRLGHTNSTYNPIAARG